MLDGRPGADRRGAQGLIAPHAGYIYSGAVAASVYARLAPVAARIKRVVLLGPAHRVAVRRPGAARRRRLRKPRWARCRSIATRSARISDLPQVSDQPRGARARALAGSALPFLQSVLGRVRAGAAGGRPRQSRRGRRRARSPVGRRRNADRDQLRPLALPRLRSGAGDRPRHRAHHPAMRQPSLNHHQACGATRSTACSWPLRAEASCPS